MDAIGALREAERALSGSDLGEALARTLEAWRPTRAPEIAQLVDAISATLEPRLPQLERGKREAMQKEWLAVEKRRSVEDVPRLVKALSETHFRSTDAMARAKKIERWPADPRVPGLLVDQLLHPQFHASSSKPFWQVVFGLFRAHADPRAVGPLERYQKRLPRVLGPDQYGDPKAAMRSWMGARTKETLKWLGERFATAPPLDKDVLEAVARCTALLGRAREATTDVFAPVFAAPEDDHARAVCADVLQERGDPRGELIALQLARAAGSASAESVAREEALLERHTAQWLGPLRDVLEARFCMFERGFLAQGFLRHDPQSLESCEGNPWWATVTSLHAPWSPEVAPLVRSSSMRSLRHLATTQEVFEAPPLAVTSLSVPGPDFRYQSSRHGYLSILDEAELEVMARSTTFPSLEHLTLGLAHNERAGGWFAFLRRLPWFSRVEALTVAESVSKQLPLAEWLDALEAFDQLRAFCVERSSNEYAICLTRPASSKWTAEVWAAKAWLGNVLPAIEAALPRLERVVLRLAPAPGPSHEKAVSAVRKRAQQVDISLEPARPGLTPLHRPLSIGDLWSARAASSAAEPRNEAAPRAPRRRAIAKP